MSATRNQFSLPCTVSKTQYPIRTACTTRLVPLLLLLLLTPPAVLQAQFKFTTNNGTITITGYVGPGGSVAIPSTINGLPVTRIGDNAFFSYANLTNVTIPNSVTSIGSITFHGCTSLPGITIPDSITSIGFAAFALCASLTSVTIPGSVTNIELAAFGSCASLSAINVDPLNFLYSSVDGVLLNKSQTLLFQYPGGQSGSYMIPNSVTSIGEFAFGNCPGLTSVTIPSGTTNIAARAFSFSTNLVSVTIPNGVTRIGDNAFYNCTRLSSIMIPKTVTSIGGYVFHSCANLGTITVDALNPAYSSVDGVLFNKNLTLLIQYPAGKVGSYTIPGSVTRIEDAAFRGCAGLSGVTIPSSTADIGFWAFSYCPNLVSITIPSSVTNIAGGAFYYCNRLAGVYFLGDAPSVPASAFVGSDESTIYYLPGSTGWGATFDERPTALWTPRIETNDAAFGVRTNRFGFNITWASDLVTVVEACTNLANPAWSPVGTNILTGGSSYFSDPEWTNHPVRFYRLRSP